MTLSGQDIAAMALVAVAGIYLLRRGWSLLAKRASTACDRCDKCPVAPTTDDVPPRYELPIVPCVKQAGPVGAPVNPVDETCNARRQEPAG